MKNSLFVFILIAFGLPAFSKANFSYVAVNGSENLVGYHSQNVDYSSNTADIYTFDDEAPLYTLKTDNSTVIPQNISSGGEYIASNQDASSKGNIDYVNVPAKNKFSVGRVAGQMLGMAAAACSVDPYILDVEGNKYVMILDNFDGIYNENDIVGINDSKCRIFSALKELNIDKDKSKLTSKELKDRGIRFVKIDTTGRLAARDYTQDFPLEKIVYIDLKNLKKIKNTNKTGVFGEFDIILKENNDTSKIVKCQVVYELPKNLEKLF